MRFGKNKGCKFLENNCLDSNYKTEFDNEFFDFSEASTPSCSTGRQSRTYSFLAFYYNYDPNYYYNFATDNQNNGYFSGSMYTTDYCFTHGQSLDDKKMNISLAIVNMVLGNMEIIYIIIIKILTNMN